MEMRVENIVGKTVATEDGRVIGTVREVIVDVASWRANDIQVKVDKPAAKEMGLKYPILGSLVILVGTDKINSTTDQIVTGLAFDAIKDYIDARRAEAEGE